jgi:hypothetical protein
MRPTRWTFPPCWASAESGARAAAPPRSVMNARRLMGSLSPRVAPYHIAIGDAAEIGGILGWGVGDDFTRSLRATDVNAPLVP